MPALRSADLQVGTPVFAPASVHFEGMPLHVEQTSA
jgi:hypothetical protein